VRMVGLSLYFISRPYGQAVCNNRGVNPT